MCLKYHVMLEMSNNRKSLIANNIILVILPVRAPLARKLMTIVLSWPCCVGLADGECIGTYLLRLVLT